MPTPRLSIVVPFHNVEDFVTPCLASLRRQTLRDVEVVLVDDGSTDGTRARVEEYAAADERFRVVEQEQSGPGPARNTGIAHSRGELLAFVDSDDLVPRRAFAHMVATLDATGSDMVAGNARRFNALGVRASYAHRLPFEETRLRTSMREFPELALDRMVWNKVYRRSFWDEHGLAFPDMLYEDYPVSMAAHAAARTVDVLEEPVYFWRERDGGELSITQHTWGMANLVDRVDSAEMVLASLEDRSLARARAKVAEHLLHIDVAAVISAVHLNDPAEHATILGLAQRLLAQVPGPVRDDAICFDRVQAHLVEQGRLPELEVLEGYRAENGVHAEVVTRGRWPRRRRYARLPFFGQDELVPSSAYLLPGDEPRLTPVVRDAVWRAGRLELDLDLGLGSFAVGPDSEVRVWLEARDGRRVELSPARYEIAVPHVGADPSGVHLSLDPMMLPDWDRPEWWVLHVGVRTPTYRGSAPVHHIGPNRGLFVGAAWLPGGVIAQPCRRQEVVGLWVRRPNAVVGRANGLYDCLELGGWFSAQEVTEPVELVLESADGVLTRLPVTLEHKREGSPPHRHPWSARVPVAPFVEHGEDVDPVEERQRVMVRLVVNGGERHLVPGTEFSGGYAAQHSRSVVATRSPIGQLVLLEGNTAPRLVDVTWADEGVRLVLSGVWEGPGALPDHVVVRRYTRARNVCEVRVPLRVEHGAFTAVVDVEELIDVPEHGPGPAETGHPDQLWHLLFEIDGTVMVPVVSRDLPSAMPGPHEVRGGAATLFLDRGDVVRVHVRRP